MATQEELNAQNVALLMVITENMQATINSVRVLQDSVLVLQKQIKGIDMTLKVHINEHRD